MLFRYIKIIRVTGNSLLPEYHPNDFVFVNTHPFFLKNIRKNDILIFQHPQHGTLIKKAKWITENGRKIFVTGTHPESIDSHDFGAISRETVTGKVFWHIKKKNIIDKQTIFSLFHSTHPVKYPLRTTCVRQENSVIAHHIPKHQRKIPVISIYFFTDKFMNICLI